MIKGYLKRIKDTYDRGDAREESFYFILRELIEEYAKKTGRRVISITTLPKKTEGGNPDFRIWNGKNRIIGYIEAKTFNKNLDQVEESKQLKRYRDTFQNLILTNFFEFRLYRDGKLIDAVGIQRPFDVFTLKTIFVSKKKEKKFFDLLDKFFSFSLPKTYTPESLAIILAKKTRFLKEIVYKELKDGDKRLIGFYEMFKKYLIFDLSEDDFSDLYSQTITYGLFAARMRSANEFNRREAFYNIPKTLGVLRDIFRFISLEDENLPEEMKWIIDDISSILSFVDVRGIFNRYYHKGKGKDLVVYFYETFLSVYDPQEREKRGVYYTPEPVVKYIVKSLNEILKEKFNLSDGLSDLNVTLLDPAAGTLSFITEAIKLSIDEFVDKYGEGGKEKFIKEHILENFYAFELMMAPYAIGHIKLSFLLEEEGYNLKGDERFKFYLTNTLEIKELEETRFPGMASLSEESKEAFNVKTKIPILVIMGNPPYSGTSYNRGEWISKEIRKYYQMEGKPLKEKTSKWLQDDYVKFIRFAQWKIDERGNGVIGFITNHSFLDNPTFRGMRYSLLKTFDEIYILNLHGNSLKKERCPDGNKDENVFDIRQGVAISFFIKNENIKEKKVFYKDVYGLREEKYKFLLENSIKTTDWIELKPHKEYFLFIPREEKGLEKYKEFIKITEIFPLHGVGMTTARDSFVIDFDKNNLLNRIRLFKNSNFTDEELHDYFKIRKKKGWSIRKAWNMLQDIPDDDLGKYILPVLYRPFDKRWIFYHDSVVWRTARRVMQHMMGENLGLLVKRQNKREPFSYALVSNLIVEGCVFESTFANNSLFPLYLYPSIDKNHMFEEKRKEGREANLNPKVIEKLREIYKREITPLEIFYYIYGVLYSNIYREKYREFLKIDFPKIPFTSNYDLFIQIGKLGERLVNLHLLKSKEIGKPISKLHAKKLNLVKTVKYDKKERRVYIDKEQFFDNIDEEVWNYMIGGYQVLNKWLKDRKGKYLSTEEIKTYTKIVTSIKKTIEIQKEIDKMYNDIEKEIIIF